MSLQNMILELFVCAENIEFVCHAIWRFMIPQNKDAKMILRIQLEI